MHFFYKTLSIFALLISLLAVGFFLVSAQAQETFITPPDGGPTLICIETSPGIIDCM